MITEECGRFRNIRANTEAVEEEEVVASGDLPALIQILNATGIPWAPCSPIRRQEVLGVRLLDRLIPEADLEEEEEEEHLAAVLDFCDSIPQ